MRNRHHPPKVFGDHYNNVSSISETLFHLLLLLLFPTIPSSIVSCKPLSLVFVVFSFFFDVQMEAKETSLFIHHVVVCFECVFYYSSSFQIVFKMSNKFYDMEIKKYINASVFFSLIKYLFLCFFIGTHKKYRCAYFC